MVWTCTKEGKWIWNTLLKTKEDIYGCSEGGHESRRCKRNKRQHVESPEGNTRKKENDNNNMKGSITL